MPLNKGNSRLQYRITSYVFSKHKEHSWSKRSSQEELQSGASKYHPKDKRKPLQAQDKRKKTQSDDCETDT